MWTDRGVAQMEVPGVVAIKRACVRSEGDAPETFADIQALSAKDVGSSPAPASNPSLIFKEGDD